MAHYKTNEPSSGIGTFTPNNFSVFDTIHSTCYPIADSNHGFKMLGVGQLLATDICDQNSALLTPY